MRISDWSSDVCSSDLLDQWRGKLAGRIVLVTRPDEGSEPDRAPFRRYDDADIAKMDEFEQPKYDPEAADRRMKRATFAKQQIGRAHVRTPVPNAHLVCRLLLEKKTQSTKTSKKKVS